MGKISITNCVFLCLTILSVRCQFVINEDASNRVAGDSLPLILKFLNDDSEAVISYKSGEIRRTQLKGDILEVDIVASVTCKSSSDQCNYESADCRGLLFVRPNSEFQVISVDCNPILPIEEPIALPIQDVRCEGCMIDINPDAKGVEQLAKNVIQHIESDKGKKYNLIKITRVQQEVTNGVNFLLTVLIGRLPHGCNLPAEECNRDTKEDMYCSVKFFQEPGYHAPKNIISNNCTSTQTFIPIMTDYQSNTIDGSDIKKNKFEEKSELSENDILKELDSQIIPTDEFESTKDVGKLQTRVETSSANNLLEESGQSVVPSSTIQEVLATEDEPISVGTDAGVNQDETEGKSQSPQEISRGSTTNHMEQQVLVDGNIDVSSVSSDLKEEEKSAVNPETNKRDKRSLVGGKKEIDVNDSTIKEYSGKAIDFLNTKLSGGNSIIKIDHIISATSQVVSGVSYDIKAQIVECTNVENSIEGCKNIPQLCDINVWYRPWLKSRIITVKLNGGTYSFDDLQTKSRSKRETLVGGWHQKEAEDPKAMEHLGKLLSNLDSQSGMDNKLRVKKILSVSTQVVAGTNWLVKALVSRSDCEKTSEKPVVECGEDKDTFETECSFKFWEKLPDSNGIRQLDNVQIQCDSPKLNYRSKRDVLVGGHNPLSEDDPRITKHLNNLLNNLDSLSDKEHKLKINKVISATSQVVAGTNWNIKASVSLSDCKKTDDKPSVDCGKNEDKYETICVFKFWEKLPDEKGLRKLENVKIECEDPKLNFRSKRETERVIKGGQGMVDASEPEVIEFVSESLNHMDEQSTFDRKFKVKEVLSATKQVVSGLLWRIKAVIVLSDCNKTESTKWVQCEELQGSSPKYCLIKVWNRPWISQGRSTNITCDDKDVYSFKSEVTKKPQGSEEFEEFVKTYNRKYLSPAERVRRFSIFQENMRYVKLLNEHEQGTAWYGATKFADLTREEFSKGLGYRSDLKNENEVDFMKAEVPNVTLPDSYDWRDKNAVTKVKNQGSCGSCWAFSVTGNVEGQYAIKNGKLLEFSEQELVDCDKVDQGCNGGLMDNAYRQIEKLGGLEEEKDYPYDARDEKCHFNKALVHVELGGAVNISQDETEMAKWLVKNGPISIAINANAMQFYMGGVSHPWKVLCNPKSLDHGVLIVGYGVHTYPKFKKALPYWIVKNSWGTSWGEQGYYRVYRGDGTCGVNQTPSSAILK